MGILSWFRSRRSADDSRGSPDDAGDAGSGGRSLLKYRYEDPAYEPIEEAAAADVARVEEDDKYFGAGSPAEADEI
jgi:hypothetical protein